MSAEVAGYTIYRDPSIIPHIKNTWPKPYHITTLKKGALRTLLEYHKQRVGTDNITLYVQPKYDGTHLQLGYLEDHDAILVRSHSGNPAANWQIQGLQQVDDIATLLGWLEEHPQYVIEAELYGRKYTPKKIHLNHDRDWDIVVFEVGIKGTGDKPPMWYRPDMDALSELGIGKYLFEWDASIVIDDSSSFLDYSRDDWLNWIKEADNEIEDVQLKIYEGLVLKATSIFDRKLEPQWRKTLAPYTTYNLWISKIKPMEYTTDKPKDKGKKVPDEWNIVLDELLNEFAKDGVTMPIDGREIYELVVEYMDRIWEAHPDLKPPSKNQMKKLYRYITGQLIKRRDG